MHNNDSARQLGGEQARAVDLTAGLDNILLSPSLAGMRALPQWIVYHAMPDPRKSGKLAKLPVHHATRVPCSVVDPANWTDVYTAFAAAATFGASYGLGFCFTKDDPYWFVDLDSCLLPDGKTWSPLAQQLAGHVLAGAAVEISASGRGLHLFGRGTVPPHSSKNIEQHAECYTQDRFVALTGTSLQGNCDIDLTAGISWTVGAYFAPRAAPVVDTPDSGPRADWNGPRDDAELLRRAMQSRSAAARFDGKATFQDLWLADADALARSYPADPGSSDPYDRSSADAALASHLAFWCGCEAARIERLMRQSKLAREKYERDDYLPRTITNACTAQVDVLKDKQPEPPPLAALAAPPAPPMPPPPPPVAAASSTMTAIEGSTFLSPAEQAEHFKGCTYIVDVHRVLVPGGDLLKRDQFKAVYGGRTFVMDGRNERTTRDAFEAFTESQALRPPRADGTCFKPALPPGHIITTEGRTRANVWWPPTVARVKGDTGPFLRHVAKLFPIESDRALVLAYLVNMVQQAGHKFQFAPVLIGVPGNETLKPMITGDAIEVESKGVDQRTDEVCGNFLFNANQNDALRKTIDDRRYMTLWCAQQSVGDLERDGMDARYFDELYSWAKRGGYAIVAEYLHTEPLPPELGLAWALGRAPQTSSTARAIEATRSPIEDAILSAVEDERPGFRGGWISSYYLHDLANRQPAGTRVQRNQFAALLGPLGYVPHPALGPAGQVHNEVKPDGGKPRLYIKRGHTAEALTGPTAVATAYSAAQGSASAPPAR